MSDAVVVEFALTNEDVARGFRSAYFKSPRFGALIVVFVLVAVAASLGDNSWLAVAGGVGTVVGVAYVAWVRPRRLVTRNPAVTAPQTVTISDEGFSQETSIGSAKLTWAAFKGVSENAEFFLLRQGTNIVIIVPKRVFDQEQLQRVHAILQSAEFRNGTARQARSK